MKSDETLFNQTNLNPIANFETNQ